MFIWDNFGSILDTTLDHFGVDLGQFWDHFGTFFADDDRIFQEGEDFRWIGFHWLLSFSEEIIRERKEREIRKRVFGFLEAAMDRLEVQGR